MQLGLGLFGEAAISVVYLGFNGLFARALTLFRLDRTWKTDD
jgi:hypothetical protein